MEWTNDAVLKLISLYEQRPVLWNQLLAEYRDKNKRHDALQEIAVHFGVEKIEIEKKLRYILSHFSRELKKEKEKRSGNWAADVYKSKWFAMKALLFLKDRNTPRDVIDTENSFIPLERHCTLLGNEVFCKLISNSSSITFTSPSHFLKGGNSSHS